MVLELTGKGQTIGKGRRGIQTVCGKRNGSGVDVGAVTNHDESDEEDDESDAEEEEAVFYISCT